MEDLDKSKGIAFIYKAPFLGRSILFYNGLHSHESYAGKCFGELIYLSGVGCKCNRNGRRGQAFNVLLEYVIEHELLCVFRK